MAWRETNDRDAAGAPEPRDDDSVAGEWREKTTVEYPCQAAGKPAVFRITNRRLVIVSTHDRSRELWSCRLQECTQVVRVACGPTTSVIFITKSAAIVGAAARFDSLFDATGRFPSVNIDSDSSSGIGAIALDQLEGEGGVDQPLQDIPKERPFATARNEQIVRHFRLGPGCDLWVTTRRLVVHRDPTIAPGAPRSFPSVATPEQTIMAKALPLDLTWEIALADISGLEQQYFRTGGQSLRYIIPLTNSRRGDVHHIPAPPPRGLFYRRGDRPEMFEFLAHWLRRGPLRKLTGPPRPATERGDNARWFWLFSIPVSGTDGEALWKDLGPTLGNIYSGELPDPAGRIGPGSNESWNWEPLGEPVKKFELPPGPVGIEPAWLVISRKGLTLWSHVATDCLSVQSLWHFFASQKQNVVLNHVLIRPPRKRNHRAAFRLLIAAPCAFLLSLFLLPHPLVLPSTVILSVLFLLYVLRPKRQPQREAPAIGIASAGQRPVPSTVTSLLKDDEEKESLQSTELPRLIVGVSTPPALLIEAEAGRRIVQESNHILNRLYEGNA